MIFSFCDLEFFSEAASGLHWGIDWIGRSGTFVTTGLSGSPIVDSHGEMAAMYVGHLTQQPTPGKMVLTAVDVAEMLPHVVGGKK